MAILFVDAATGNDVNDGGHSVPVSSTELSWQASQSRVTSGIGAFATYQANGWRKGDLIYLSHGSITDGFWEIASVKTSGQIILVNKISESNINAEITTGGFDGPIATLAAAAAVWAPGDTIAVRNGTNYDTEDGISGAVMEFQTPGTDGLWVIVKGWDTALTDSEMFTIDGSAGLDGIGDAVLVSPKEVFIVVSGVHIQNCLAAGKKGISCAFSQRLNVTNFLVHDCANRGIRTDVHCIVCNGEVYACGADGIVCDAHSLIAAIKSHDNGDAGIQFGGWATLYQSACYRNGEEQAGAFAHDQGAVIIQNVFDAGGIGTIGLELGGSTSAFVVNNQIANCTTGIAHVPSAGSSSPGVYMSGNNYWNNSVADFPASITDLDPRYVNPKWRDAANGDFRPLNPSAAMNHGFGLEALDGLRHGVGVSVGPYTINGRKQIIRV